MKQWGIAKQPTPLLKMDTSNNTHRYPFMPNQTRANATLPRPDNDADQTQRNFPPRFHDTQFLCEGLTRFLSRAGTFKINCAERQQINSDTAHLAPPWSNKLVELATIGLWIKNLLSERKSTPRTSTLQIQMCCFLRRDRMHVPGNCSTEEPFVNELIVNATARPFRSSKLAVDVTCGVPNDR